MSKTWVFIGGMVAGIAGVFAAAFAAEEFDARKQNSVLPQQQLELPEGRETKSYRNSNFLAVSSFTNCCQGVIQWSQNLKNVISL